MDVDQKNEETTAREVKEWNENPPDKYFAYIKETDSLFGVMTTWMGDKLGEVKFKREFTSNMGDTRVSITVWGTNGHAYYGTYYKSAGDYCRIKEYKHD